MPRTVRLIAVFTVLLLPCPAAAQAPPAGPAVQAAPPSVRWFVRNWTRVETWRFFEPQPGGGDPDYTFVANRLQAGIERRAARWDATAIVQFVQLGGLPAGAVGPGPLGTGALYFDHAGRTDSRGVYVRTLNVRLKGLGRGVDLTAGRMPYASGGESPSGSPAIEAVKRPRLDSRLVGEFEWSHFQRSFDGVRIDVDWPAWRLTGSAFRPTQGGFEEDAGASLRDVFVGAAVVSLKPGTLAARTDVQLAAYRYDDGRRVAARPDNTGLAAAAVDVGITTLGGSAVGVYPAGTGQIDFLFWAMAQTGDWYGQRHRASALAAEVGHQWTGAAWRPWLRAGVLAASGDDDPGDDRHGTFFQMLPTGRKYSLSTLYSLMNLRDVFVQVMARPAPRLAVRADVHRVSLATAADRWYGGSGATQRRGTVFGFAGRPSRGATSLGTVLEGSVDVTLTRRWSINGYAAAVRGGEVVRRTFAGRRLVFAYLENVLSF